MTATVTIVDDTLHIELHGVKAKMALRSRVEVPLADVRSAGVQPVKEARAEQGAPELWPVAGAFVPGVLRVGSFGSGDRKQFW